MRKVAFLLVALSLAYCWYWWIEGRHWETLDKAMLAELSAEQGKTITYAAARWQRGKIVKVVLRGPGLRETRYFDGRKD